MNRLTHKITHINKDVVKIFAGQFLITVGVVEFVIYFFPYTSSMVERFTFSFTVACLWIGCWATVKRYPALWLTCFYAGMMIAVWQAKYGAV